MSERVPDGWEVTTIDNSTISVLDGDRGKEYPKERDFMSQGYCLFLSAKNVTKNGFKFDDCSFITEEKDRKLRKGRLTKGDIVITTRGTVGNIAYFDDYVPYDVIRINSGMAILRNNDNLISFDFFYQLMGSQIINQQLELLTFGSAQPQLTIGVINSLRILTPPPSEQQKIASILTSVDEVIEKTESQINKLQDMKKGIMQELLTKGIGHTEFKDSPVGRIPKGWAVAPFSEVCSLIRDGTHLPPERVPEGVPLLSVRNMQNGHFELLNDDTYVTEEFYAKMHSKWKPETGDLLLAVVGATIGKVGQVPDNFPIFTLQRSVAVLRGKKKVFDNDFLYAYAQSEPFSARLWDRVNQTAQPGIYLAEIGKIQTPVPPISEQYEIAHKVGSVSSLIYSKKRKHAALLRIKKALMQDLLTGKVRVCV